MEHFKIMDGTNKVHLVFIGWNRLLANDQIGIFVHCSSHQLNNFYHNLKAFSNDLCEAFGNDHLVKVR